MQPILTCSPPSLAIARPQRRYSRNIFHCSRLATFNAPMKAGTCSARGSKRLRPDQMMIVQAARELATRAMAEDLQGRNCLPSPRRSALSSPAPAYSHEVLPHEVFVCIHLDAQHRVITFEGNYSGGPRRLSTPQSHKSRIAGRCSRRNLFAQSPLGQFAPEPSRQDSH